MTREEIARTASDLNHDLRYRGDGESRADCRHIEATMVALVRATLEEAARVVCPDCRNEVALEAFKKIEKTYWSHQSEKGDTARCDAGPIHDLIAALDKEDKGE